MSNVLVTGGAGFIGSFIADELIKRGHNVRIFDNLVEHIHKGRIPSYLNKKAEFVKGDVRNYAEFSKALEDIDIVFHEASLVGIEPSMAMVKEFVDVNDSGTSNLLDIIIRGNFNIKKIIVPGSVAIYGESVYICEKCDIKKSEFRSKDQLAKKQWELICPKCGREMKALNVPEDKEPYLNNLYSLTKYDQEKICLLVGKKYGIPVSVLRYFNVYGPRQSVVNPYSGVVTKFVDNILAGKQIKVFEDGEQSRDFINVKDIVRANIMAMESSKADFESFNVGTGHRTTIKEIAETLIEIMGIDAKLIITNNYRPGDVRHCTADITKITNALGFKPEIGLREGLKEVVDWQKSNK
jgi:dTDP-L-rhamnose 4-epimerase